MLGVSGFYKADFPDRRAPQLAEYSTRKTYGHLLDMFEKALQRKNPLFTLPMYYPLAWYTGSDTADSPAQLEGAGRTEGADLHRVCRHRPLPQLRCWSRS
jgi:hypothetical protein